MSSYLEMPAQRRGDWRAAMRALVLKARMARWTFTHTFVELVGLVPKRVDVTTWDVRCWSGLDEPNDSHEWGEATQTARRAHHLQYLRHEQCGRPTCRGSMCGVYRHRD